MIDLGHGRGWLAPEPAQSIFRIDAHLGRPADINEAGRSAADADANFARWLAYKKGTGPWAPYALPASQSVHCQGYAVDSDDWYDPAAAAVWREHGWVQTARYDDDRDEPWHGEYDRARDRHYGESGKTHTPVPPSPAARPQIGEEPMFIAEMPNGWFLVVPQGNGQPRAVVLDGGSGAQYSNIPRLKFETEGSIRMLTAAVVF